MASDSSLRRELVDRAFATPVVDAHTHVQDDLTGFDQAAAGRNLAGTQASFNRPSGLAVERGLAQRRMVRRTMTDLAHGLYYSWFAEIVEGRASRLDDGIRLFGDNTDRERRAAARFALGELLDSRYTEYAEWIRFMLRQYDGVPADIDPLAPEHVDTVADAVAAQRHDPAFAAGVLERHNVVAYVTSIENRDKVPERAPIRTADVDLSYATHPEAWCMLDFNKLLWPERATDFGLFFQGRKFQAERYIPHLEEFLGKEIASPGGLKDAVHGFFVGVLRSPRTNPRSRVLYVDGFQAHDWRFSGPYSTARVAWALAHCRDQLDGEDRRQVIACVAEAMLEALDEVGRERRGAGASRGCCIQLCGGARHFMDWAREIQSIPEHISGLAVDEYPVWARYPNVHFEYLCAHRALYEDMAGAAKQVGNVSAGPWWHFFRRDAMAAMFREQLAMGPISSVACGFTDARFVEMMAAKYRSLRLAVADALATFVTDPFSSLHNDVEAAAGIMREMLYTNPAAVHSMPLPASG
jgi:hypothetical protein